MVSHNDSDSIHYNVMAALATCDILLRRSDPD